MKGIKIGVIVEKKTCGTKQESSTSSQKPSNGETQVSSARKNVYVNDSVSHRTFVKNIFSILAT